MRNLDGRNPLTQPKKNTAGKIASPVTKNARGRPKVVWLEETANAIIAMRSGGLAAEYVAKALRVNVRTLYRHYKDELEIGAEMCAGKVAAVLVKRALDGDVRACEFFLKCRAGWKPAAEEAPGAEGRKYGVVEVPETANDAAAWQAEALKYQPKQAGNVVSFNEKKTGIRRIKR